jgi:WD40 repeat protein
LKGHTAAVESIAWDPTGRYLASGSDDTYVMLWDVEGSVPKSGSSTRAVAGPLHKWKVTNSTGGSFQFKQNWLCWSNDGKTLAVVTQDNHIQLFDAFSSATMPRIFQNSGANGGFESPSYIDVAWSPTSNTFATYDISDQSLPHGLHVNLWRTTQQNKPTRTLTFTGVPANVPSPDAIIDVLAWSSDGSLLAAHTFFGTVIIWEAIKGTVQHVINLPSRPSPPGNFFNNECLV